MKIIKKLKEIIALPPYVKSFRYILNFYKRHNNRQIIRQIIKQEKISKPSSTAIIIGNAGHFKHLLYSPTCYDLETLIKYLEIKESTFKVFWDIHIDEFDKIIKNPTYKRIYLIGHGTRDSFMLNKKEKINYSSYSKQKRSKEFIAQWHCCHGGGKSLADYIVKKNLISKCDITNSKRYPSDINKKIKKMYNEAAL